jgi:Ca2+-binding RTX toxin-like protein
MSSFASGGAETRVNTYTTGAQDSSTIAALADGGWIVAWDSLGVGGDSYGIYQQRYGANGRKVGGEMPVNTYMTSAQNVPEIAALSDGGWITAWSSFEQDGNGYGIYQQRYDAGGRKVGAETQVSSYTGGDQVSQSLTVLADGGWVLAWESYLEDGDSTGIYQQRFTANGKALGRETQVNGYTTGTQSATTTVALSDGGWVVAWQSDGQDGSNNGIYQQRYDTEGDEIGTKARVNSYTVGEQMLAQATSLSDGGWLVTWQSAGQDGFYYGVFQQRYDADGMRQGGEIQVNTYTLNDQSRPAVTELADGGWLVTWSSAGQDDGIAGLYQQRYDKNGNATGGETQVNLNSADFQDSPDVAALADGGWVISWSVLNADGDRNGIYQRHFAAAVSADSGKDRLVGTRWDEYLLGYGGNDRLDGRGGDDVLIGGFGNDTYVVNSKGDDVQELAARGTDTVLASIGYTLGGAVENLTLTGKAELNGTGNTLDNVLTGNIAANILKGGAGEDVLTGGKGNDTLYGGVDADRFVFHKGDGKDVIRDFDTKGSDHDVIDLSHVSAIQNFSDLTHHHMQQHGSSVVIDDGQGDTITLIGVKTGQLVNADFHF